MINVYPFGIPSAEQVGYPQIPTVYGILSAEAFGTPDVPKFAGISSGEKFGLPTVGIWWLHWREFDRKNMYSKTYRVFPTVDTRIQYAQGLMLKDTPELIWKVGLRAIGSPVLPKARKWEHITICLRESLK
jgi:hypothetical protein